MRSAILFLLLALAGAAAASPEYRTKEYVPNYIASTTKGAERDSIWGLGHAYRQWIFDQNYLADDNSNLDPSIVYLHDGKIRSHPERVYFYNDMDVAMEKARLTGLPVAFYLFDHTCSECLFVLPQLYARTDVAEASKDFINCYVELPQKQREATALGLMSSSLTVQFVLPGGRRLRVLDDPDLGQLLKSYADMQRYVSELDEAELFLEPRQAFQPTKGGY